MDNNTNRLRELFQQFLRTETSEQTLKAFLAQMLAASGTISAEMDTQIVR